jgi:hypothetical protein
MISAPQGQAAGLPGHTASCATAPPLFASAGAAAPAASQSTIPVAGGGLAALTPAINSVAAALAGATTVGAAPAVPSTIQPVATGVLPVAPPLAQAPAAAAAAPAAATIGAGPAAAPSIDTNALVSQLLTALLSAQGIAGVVGAGPVAAATLPTGANAAPAAPVAPAPTQPLTTVAPGANPNDAVLVEQTLAKLRQSPSGAQVVDRLLAVGAKVNVISDAEFAQMGHDTAHAFYDPKIDTMFLRRSDLADQANVGFAALALAHEGTHLLDDVAGLSDPFVSQLSAQIAAAGGLDTPQGQALREQGMFELTMIKETRAFTFAGQIARDLGVEVKATDPTSVAKAGGNDQATYDAVWQRLLTTSYNEGGRSAAPRNF